MSEKIEPGLYWATIKRPNKREYEAVVLVFTDGEMEEQWPDRQMFPPGCGVSLGPRIPTAEELEEWKKDSELHCAACGSPNFAWYAPCDDSQVVWHCADCGNEQAIETRYRVVEE